MLVPNVASFSGWITILVGMEMKLPHLSFKGPICLRMNCSLQLRGKGYLGKEEKATKRERKARELYVEVREKAMRARKNVQACTSGIMGIFCVCNVGFVFCLNIKKIK